MAEKTTSIKSAAKEEPAVKAAASVAETKTPEKKEEVKAEKTVKTETKKEEKAPAKKETVKAAKKTVTKKTTTRKTAAKKAEEKPAEKPAVKRAEKKAAAPVVHLQFGGKSYAVDDIQKIAADVWKFDLQHEEDYTSLELYVKPEENRAYYVFNGDIAGSFGL